MSRLMHWFPVVRGLGSDPNFFRLAELLGVDVPTVQGYWLNLIDWACDNAPDGDLSRFNAGLLARVALWLKDAEAFHTALRESQVLRPDGRLIHWDEVIQDRLDGLGAKATQKREARKREAKGHPGDIAETATERPSQSKRENERKKERQKKRKIRVEPLVGGMGGPQGVVEERAAVESERAVPAEWSAVIATVRDGFPPLARCLENGRLVSFKSDAFEVSFPQEHKADLEFCRNSAARLKTILDKRGGVAARVVFREEAEQHQARQG